MSEKLHKVLAQSGLGSRRYIETLIAAGRISVDGKLAHIGQRVERQQRLCFDQKPISVIEAEHACELLLYHKPSGEICTQYDPQGRETVFDRLPKPQQGKWMQVGRLDINTSGLLLFTNHGELAHRLMHPSYEIEREYAVRVFGQVEAEHLQRLTRGVSLEDGAARFEEIVSKGKSSGLNQWYYVLLKSGRNRLVRRLWESQSGLRVSRLIRVRFAHLTTPKSLAAGSWEILEQSDIQLLRQACKL